MKLPVVISFLNALPICAMPKGRRFREDVRTLSEVDEDALRGFGSEIDEGVEVVFLYLEEL